MRSFIFGVVFALAAGWLASVPTDGEEYPTRMVQIQCEAYELRADGEKTRLTRPQLMTIEGTAASFNAGSPLMVEIERDRKLEIATGVECQVACYCLASGKVKLDLDFAITKPASGEDERRDGEEGIVTRKSGVRVVRTVNWGERNIVSLRNDDGKATHAIELVVTEHFHLPLAPSPDEVPPAPPGRRVFDFDIGGVPIRPAPGPRIR